MHACVSVCVYVCTRAFLVCVCACVRKRMREGEREGETEYGKREGRGRMGVLHWYASCTFLMKRYIDIHVHTKTHYCTREICFIKFGLRANDPTSLKGILSSWF